MAQPANRNMDVQTARAPDESRGEFWIGNPWKFMNEKHNLSAYEPNLVFLNAGDRRFVDIGHLTGANSDGDGRGALVVDVTSDLAPDLIVRQVGGGPLLFFENRFGDAHRLVVSLRGTKSNRLGIGARVEAVVDGRRLVRQLFPTNNYMSHQASQVRFGLGQANRVDRLVVHWPSGAVQTLNDIKADRHILITEGADKPAVLREVTRPTSRE